MPSLLHVKHYAAHSAVPPAEKARFALRSMFFRLYGPCAIATLIQQHRDLFCAKFICKVLEAPQRLFYDNRMGFYQRSLFIKDHYELLIASVPADLVRPLLNGQAVTVARFVGKTGAAYDIRLAQDFLTEKEGCLNIGIYDEDGSFIVKAAFSLSSVGPRVMQSARTIKIGCIQSTAVDTCATLKATTKDFYGFQPRLLLLDVLRLLAQSLNFSFLEGVSQEHHVYSAKRYKKDLRIDYDQLWAFLGFTREVGGNFSAPAAIHSRELTDYPSHKRSEHRKRQLLVSSLQDQIAAALGRSEQRAAESNTHSAD